MAHMYPPQIAEDHGSRAERAMYAALATQLSDDFYCYHSKPLLTREGRAGAREAEIDFVVLHAGLGLLALEVKGGGLHRDGQGRWFRRKGGGDEQLKKDPFDQARQAMHDLVALLERRIFRSFPPWRGKLRLPFGHALCLPDVSVEDGDFVPSGIEPELLLDSAAVGELASRIPAAMKVWRHAGAAPVDPRQFKRFRRHVFHPALHLATSLGAMVQRDETALVRMTDKQLHLLDMAAAVPRVQVRGAAGTGKTVIALEKARRLVTEDGLQKVGLLCFNRPLANALARRVAAEQLDDRITACNFHSLCHQAARALDRPFDVPDGKEEAVRFWHETAPEHLLEAVSEGVIGFDALVVDEAQDFDSAWWVTIDELCPQGAPLWVFFDPQQDIYRRAADLPDGLVPLVLSENCRATRCLRQLCDRLSGTETLSPPFAPEGEPHEEIAYDDETDLRAKLDARVRELCEEVGPGQLTILAPHRWKNTSIAGLKQLGGQPLVSARDSQDPGILVSTARRFKGLEADVVLLIDQDLADPACTAIHRYVAASRAKHRLIVFAKGPWLETPG